MPFPISQSYQRGQQQTDSWLYTSYIRPTSNGTNGSSCRQTTKPTKQRNTSQNIEKRKKTLKGSWDRWPTYETDSSRNWQNKEIHIKWRQKILVPWDIGRQWFGRFWSQFWRYEWRNERSGETDNGATSSFWSLSTFFFSVFYLFSLHTLLTILIY